MRIRRPQPPTDAWRRASEQLLLGFGPLLVSGAAFYFAVTGGWGAGDFHRSFLVAAWRVLHGGDPYHWTAFNMRHAQSFPYPAPVALLLAPLTLLPVGLADVLFMGCCIGALIAALRLAGVRDWRVYGIALLWSQVIVAWQVGNTTLILLALIAAAWRFRDRPRVAGLAVGLLVSIKPIMLPVALWLLASHRTRAAAYAGTTVLVLNLVSWTVLGWNEFGRWIHLLSLQSTVMYRDGYGCIALLARAGAGRWAATVAELVTALVLAAALARLAWRGHDGRGLALAISLTLVATPLVDDHYFALMVMSLALFYPRLSWPWGLPLVLWACPATAPQPWQIGLWLGVAAFMGVLLVTREEPSESVDLHHDLLAPYADPTAGREVLMVARS